MTQGHRTETTEDEMRSTRARWVTVTCPVCDHGSVRCEREEGDPDVGIRGGVGDFDAECACATSGLVDEDKYWERLNEIADFTL